MIYFVIPYTLDGPVTKALKKELKRQSLRYKLGNLGELMDENFTAAIKHKHLLYKASDLKRLKDVNSNPDVVDIAFEVLATKLHEKGEVMPEINEGRIPYYPNLGAIFIYTAINAIVMTATIYAIVIFFQESIGVLSTLITIVSILGAIAFVWTLAKCVTYVDIPTE